MVNKKVVIIATTIAIIIVSAIFYLSIRRFGKIEYTFNEVKESNVINEKKISEQNSTEENTTDENSTVESNTIENNTIKNSTTEENTSVEQKVEKTGKDLAVELAKDKWGKEDNSVYYYIEEQKSDNKYIVSVRNKDTTARIIDYEVDIQNKTVEEY